MFTAQFLPPNKALQKCILQPEVLLQCLSAAQLSIIASFTGFILWFYFLFSHPYLPSLEIQEVDTKRKNNCWAGFREARVHTSPCLHNFFVVAWPEVFLKRKKVVSWMAKIRPAKKKGKVFQAEKQTIMYKGLHCRTNVTLSMGVT